MKEKFDEVLDEMIQAEAESLYDRWLEKEELEDVRERVCGNLFIIIQDTLNEIEDEQELKNRNEDSSKNTDNN